MAHVPAQRFTDNMQLLYGVGTCAGMTDGELLERFLAGRDEAGELAFETLAARHGPMIIRVCRNVLDDPHDVHDAVQAVFLVLARRAMAIRQRDSVASWLYGVALRVTARAKVTSVRRHMRDRRTIEAAQTSAALRRDTPDESPIERNDRAEVVHQEVGWLPEKFRAPVVLCYLEGLTHDEAAARLSWPVGTVRSRLARARDRLRTRLSRRGVSAPVSTGPIAHWLTAQPGVSPRWLETVSATSSAPIDRQLLTSILRAISARPGGAAITAVSIISPSVLLAEGVLKAMFLRKLIVIAGTILPLGTAVLGVGLILASRTDGQVLSPPAASAVSSVGQSPGLAPPRADDIDRLARELLEAARKRYETQKAFYEEGRSTIDRLIDASKALELAELRLATTDADWLAVRRQHVDRINELEKRENAELAVGRGTVADVTEAHHRHVEAELDLKINQRRSTETATLLNRVDELERKVDQLQKERAGR
jgi:RNA polymerase sigma factor (sigma-70 family)